MIEFTDEEVKKIIEESYDTDGDLIEHWRKEGYPDKKIAEILFYEM